MSNQPLDQRSLEALASMIRDAVATGRYKLLLHIQHTRNRMAEFDYERGDIIDMLKGCTLTAKELHGSQWRYRAEGGNFENGKRMVVILEIEEETSNKEEILLFLVITVWPQE